jgi:hypothetical protein
MIAWHAGRLVYVDAESYGLAAIVVLETNTRRVVRVADLTPWGA